jgi:Capsule polysaccharide biosynthesis protein
VRFLFSTLQFRETDFYARVGERLREAGHEVSHVCFSRRGANSVRRRGFETWCLPDEMAGLGGVDAEAEAARIEERYALPSLRSVYRIDWPCEGRSERSCLDRTVRHFLAMERIFDDSAPDVVVPEVGNETMRQAAHHIGLAREIPVFFLLYTIFPAPLRLYVDTLHAPIVSQDELRPLEPSEREEVERFIATFSARGKPIRDYRVSRVTPSTLRDFARHVAVAATQDRDNEYLRPQRFVVNWARLTATARLARRLYEPVPFDRPFVYFPLHVTDDYKIKGIIPHCQDQASIAEQVADALPQGYDLVIKEHPMSIGRNGLGMLRRLAGRPDVVLVDPYTSSHELIRRSAAVAVISSTVGLEALLYAKPVLTLGQPFYGGYDVTVDVDSFREIPAQVPAVLRFRPDRERILRFLHAAMRACLPGAPVLVDDSDANAYTLAASLERAARAHAGRRPEELRAR